MKKIYLFLFALILTVSASAQTFRDRTSTNGSIHSNTSQNSYAVGVVSGSDQAQITNCTLTIPAPATDSRAVDLGLSVKWASCNVGATAPEEYGGYYAWGETEEKNSYFWSNYKYYNNTYNTCTKYIPSSSYGTVDDKTTLEPEDDVATVKWGGNWRMPTLDEIKELINNCTWEWTTLNGVNGYRVTGPNGNSIFLPATGWHSGAEVSNQGSVGAYWSSVDSSHLAFSSDRYLWIVHKRYKGLSVRPVCP